MPFGTKLARHTRRHAQTGTKLARHTRRHAQTGTKLARHARRSTPTGTKLAIHRKNRPFRAIFGMQGEKCHAFCAGTRSRATFSRCGFEQSKLGDLWCATSGRFLSGSTSSSSRPPAWATESSLWHSHGLHVHHVAWRLGCFERNIAPAWDCACRHEILIAPTRLKPLILTLFRRAGVVFLSRRPSNTQHSGAQGRYFFHGSYRTRSTAACWGDVSFTVRPQPRHTSHETTPAEATERRHAQQAHKTGPVIIHRPRFVCISARSACTNA